MKELIITTVFILLAGVAFSQEKTDTVKHDSTSYFLVSGKLIDSTGKPKSGKWLGLLFGEKGSLVVGEGSRLANPSGETDANGNFHLKVNKLLLSNFEYKFMLQYKLGMDYPIVSDMNIPIVFEIDSTVEKLDLGEIQIK